MPILFIISVLYYLNYMLSLFALLSVCSVLFLYWKLLTPRQIPCVCANTLGNKALSDSDSDLVNTCRLNKDTVHFLFCIFMTF